MKLFNRQTSDSKRALHGRQPTGLIVFTLFVCFNLFCRYLSKDDAEKRKILEHIDQKVGTTRACGGTAVPNLAKPNPQILSNHHSKHKPPIKTNLNPSKHKICTPLNPNPKTKKNFTNLHHSTHKPHFNPNPITKSTLPTQNLVQT